ncbi:MAG: UDP-N-acetylmuramoyl-L-alanyl-D-glutamate--2,6-diaminopimelate ligase [Ruminococcaceae bacterium]|nr:UDP-N-acetylmuramoyl-L-alanyl-D-glutamate--2,6-diaminopimelate ligase [Oscillospiraceae bacterium]
MRLGELFREAEIGYPEKYRDIEIKNIVTDSRRVSEGCAFVCIKGSRHDGHTHIGEAIEKGAVVIVAERGRDECVGGAAAIICVDDTRHAISLLYNAWYGKPTSRMKLIGITGTNGKTSVSFILKKIFESVGYRCGVIGTVGCFVGDERIESENCDPLANMTTPDPEELYRVLSDMRDMGTDFVFMEATSHALALRKLDALFFDCAVFTNLTQDHLDFHGTMERYFEAKASLFGRCRRAVINLDSSFGERLYRLTAAKEKYLVSMDGKGDFFADKLEYNGANGFAYTLCHKDKKTTISSKMTGSFFVNNTLTALAVATIYGIDPEDSARAVADMNGIEGRMERVDLGDDLSLFIDYAHTPDALEKLLKSMREIKSGKGRIILLFGCGGERDRGKRKLMGQIASRLSDTVIITSDNSRGENPEAIIRDILLGIDKEKEFAVIPDRRTAIKYAVESARQGDVVILAGKGHERYEIDASGRHSFDERAIAASAYKEIKETEGRKRDEGQYRLG